MKFGIIKMHRDEYRDEYLAARDYYITFLGIPIYSARFTSTNNDAVQKLTVFKNKQIHVCGFTNTKLK